MELTFEYGYCKCGCGKKTSRKPLPGRVSEWTGEPRDYYANHGPGIVITEAKCAPSRSAKALYVECPKTGCWIWHTCSVRTKYGSYKGRGAHRVMYEAHNGPIPEGLVIDHLCRTPACVNPLHLEPVSTQENIYRAQSLYPHKSAIVKARESNTPVPVIASNLGLSENQVYFFLWGRTYVAPPE